MRAVLAHSHQPLSWPVHQEAHPAVPAAESYRAQELALGCMDHFQEPWRCVPAKVSESTKS